MKHLQTDHDDNRIIIGVVAGLSLLLAVGLGVMSWFNGVENGKKAEELFAKAQDACRNDSINLCLSQVNSALRLKEKQAYYQLKFNALDSDGKYSEAKLVMEKLLTYEPNNAHFHYLMRGLADTDGDSELATKSMDKALELAPNNGDYWITKAMMLVNASHQKEATAIYEKLLASEPQRYEYWDQYALSYSNNEQYADALQIRLRGAKQFPNEFMQHFGLASLYDTMGKKPEAVAEYRKSLELHPLENSIAAKRIYEITGRRVPPQLENATSDRIPFESKAKVMFIAADINGEKGKFLLDTGASMSVIFESKVSLYHIQPIRQVLSFETANGFIQAPIAYGNVRLGKHDMENVRFAVIPDQSDGAVDGIIGMNILEHFQFEIDQAGQTLVLRGK